MLIFLLGIRDYTKYQSRVLTSNNIKQNFPRNLIKTKVLTTKQQSIHLFTFLRSNFFFSCFLSKKNWICILSLTNPDFLDDWAGVNFINILWTNFLYACLFGSFVYVHVTRDKLPKQCSYEKFVRKMLMKLTTGRSKIGSKALYPVLAHNLWVHQWYLDWISYFKDRLRCSFFLTSKCAWH